MTLTKAILLIITVFLCIGCKDSKVEDQKLSSLYSSSSSIGTSHSSGTYPNNSISISFTTSAPNTLAIIYKNDTLTSKGESVTLTINNTPGKLSQIPTSSKDYIIYAHSWSPPIGKQSSFHQIKAIEYNGNTVVDSLISNFILGATRKDNFPIANIQVNENWLFNPDTGCYVPGNSIDINNENGSGNFYKFKKRKQPGSIQIIDNNREYLNGTFSWRIHGYMTPKAPQKSLLFYLKEKTKINSLLKVEHNVDKIILRSGYSGWGTKMFVDGFIADACEGLNLDVMAYKPLKIYLNGEYWGIQGLRERMDLKAIANKYDIKKKNLLDADDKGYSSEQKEYGELKVLFDTIKANPYFPFENIANNFYMPSLIDWLIAEMFFQNNDWPSNNTFFWKNKKGNDKWKCVLIDMDACVGEPEYNLFENAIEKNSTSLGNVFITYLFNQKEFVLEFKKRAEYLLSNDFSSTKLMAKFKSYQKLFEPAVEEHFNRWGNTDGLTKYNRGINTLQTFCEKRQAYFLSNMNDYIESKSSL